MTEGGRGPRSRFDLSENLSQVAVDRRTILALLSGFVLTASGLGDYVLKRVNTSDVSVFGYGGVPVIHVPEYGPQQSDHGAASDVATVARLGVDGPRERTLAAGETDLLTFLSSSDSTAKVTFAQSTGSGLTIVVLHGSSGGVENVGFAHPDNRTISLQFPPISGYRSVGIHSVESVARYSIDLERGEITDSRGAEPPINVWHCDRQCSSQRYGKGTYGGIAKK